ncbi:universal stress protein [Hanstruepera marina]|uniref:universal stress protein n=1 Tax=Hanstruepera marina TaxID=2873265 RepID=UPI001CA69BE8|nr:universal stress protein [Hanstruepera marina]
MKKILITTDFSDNANHALEYAMQLFKYEDCQFYILHVLKASTFVSDDLMSMSPTTSLYDQLIASAKLKLDKYIDTVKSKHNNILHEFIPVIDYDNLVAAVNQLVDKNNIQLAIMGTKGASNVAKKILGSNTMHVIQGCQVSVLAIPHNYNYKPIHRVAFTSHYENKYCKADLSTLINLVEQKDYQVSILHVSDTKVLTKEQEQVKASLDDCFENATHQFTEIKDGTFLSTISHYVESHSIDMLAMVHRKHGFWESLFTENKIQKIAYNINIPLLVMS